MVTLIRVDLTLMAFSDVVDAIILQCHPIIFDPHYLPCHYVLTSVYATNTFVNLMHDFLGLNSVYTSQQYLVLTFLIENLSV